MMSDTNLLYLIVSMAGLGFLIPIVAPSLLGMNKPIDKDAANRKPWK